MQSNMIVIKIWTFIVVFACTVYGQKKPPNYQQNDMPVTSFSCKDKIVGGYYADTETACQMFHVCVNVVGTGVQDFRFLCPNDTAFDQENQICDDWYNIDCEAATLYYSDNFDLYRLGVTGRAPSSTPGKATPIPLGPSAADGSKARPPAVVPRKPLVSAVPVNNAVSEVSTDDDYYLQRSDASDAGAQQDLLRGSSSGNFFSNQNRGAEDDYDDAGKHVSSWNTDKAAKAPFRKLLTGKKPVPEQTAFAAASTAAAATVPVVTTPRAAFTTTMTGQPGGHYKPTTYRSKDRGRVNYKTYLDKQAKADEFDYQKVSVKPVVRTTTFVAPVSTADSYRNAGRPLSVGTTAKVNAAVYAQTTQINDLVQAPFVSAPVGVNQKNDFLRIAPINHHHNNNNGFQSNRIHSVPVDNNGFQPGKPLTNDNAGGFQSNQINSVPANNDYRPINNGGNAFQPQNGNFNNGGNAFQPQNSNFNNGGNAFQQQNGNFNNQVHREPNSTPAPFRQTTSVNTFRTSPQPSTTERFSKDTKAKFDPYSSYMHQRTNDEPAELLKTAPSSNIRASDLNALVQQHSRPKIVNATLSVGYSFGKTDGGVAKSTVIVPAPTTQKPRPFTTTQQVTTGSSSTTTTTTTTTATTKAFAADSASSKKAVAKDTGKDSSSYDYAYYDDSNHNDYTDVVPEDFSRIDNAKKF